MVNLYAYHQYFILIITCLHLFSWLKGPVYFLCFRRHVLQCAAEILNKHIVKLLSSNYRLYSLSQEDNIVQLDPYFEQGYSESQVPESSNANDLYHCYGYQRFWGQKFGEKVSMSVGTNIGERNHNGSQNGMSTLDPSSGKLSKASTVVFPSTACVYRKVKQWTTSCIIAHVHVQSVADHDLPFSEPFWMSTILFQISYTVIIMLKYGR